jgi:hypothetical protein
VVHRKSRRSSPAVPAFKTFLPNEAAAWIERDMMVVIRVVVPRRNMRGIAKNRPSGKAW